MDINDLTGAIIGAAIEMHKTLGPGLLESAYKSCLAHELCLQGLTVEVERSLPLTYNDLVIPCAYRLDLVVEDKVIVEVKCATKLIPVFEAQLLSYLKLTGIRVGLLFNFHEKVLIQGLRRLIVQGSVCPVSSVVKINSPFAPFSPARTKRSSPPAHQS